jgi:glycosyltransferase involved in cell wall biosynthesis
MKLSIIIPCYNEEQTIKSLLESLFKVKFPIEREIIVVDDGSHRNHKELIEEEIRLKKVKFIRLQKNQGKGVAIRIGLRHADGNIFVIQDADLEYFPSDILNLLKPIFNNECEVVFGTRFFVRPENMSGSHFIGNRILTTLTNRLYKSNITDMETGYKMFTKKVYKSITLSAREFELEPEITAKILLKGYKIIEVPIKYNYRRKGNAKINWLDGIEGVMILFILRYFSNSKLIHFVYRIFKFHIKKIVNKLMK